MTAPSLSRSPWLRLGVTLLAPLAVIAGRNLPLPNIDVEALQALVGRTRGLFVGPVQVPGMMALGIMPVLIAYLLVELAASLVPRWQPLRHGGLEGRSKLERATAVTALLVALLQAWNLYGAADRGGLLYPTGLLPTVVLVLSLVGGVALLMLIARVIGRYGLCNGFAALGVVTFLYDDLVSVLHAAQQDATAAAATAATVVVGVAIVAGATLIALGVRWDERLFGREAPADRAPAPADEPGPVDYRTSPGVGAHVAGSVPVPASGLAPLECAQGLLALPGAVWKFGLGFAWAPPFLVRMTSLVPVQIALVAGAGVGFGVLFNAPARVAALRLRVERAASPAASATAEKVAREDVRDALVQTLAFLGVLTAVRLGSLAYAPIVVAPAIVALATALCADVVAEWRARRDLGDLVLIRPEHRPYAVAPARAALGAVGIPMFARGVHQRTMLQGFGPWVPIEILVRPEDADKAARVVTRALDSRLPRPSSAEAGAPARPKKRRKAAAKAPAGKA